MMRRVIRKVALAAILSLTLLMVPDGGVAPAGTTLVKVQRADGVDHSPGVIWILAMGSDARPGQRVLGTRADAIQLVGLNPKTGAATAIGIPRDSWVNVPGHGNNKINTGLYYGGPQLMADAVQGLVGIEPDYVMVTSFWGLRHMVDAIGPITVNSRFAFSDPYLRPKGFSQGRNKLDGMGALAFSRIRKSLPAGDFDRSRNQQETIRAIHRKIRANADQPAFLDKGVLAVLHNMDAQVPPTELFKLARVVASIDPGKVTGCVVPGGTGSVGGASVVFADRGTAQRYGNDARNDAVIKRC